MPPSLTGRGILPDECQLQTVLLLTPSSLPSSAAEIKSLLSSVALMDPCFMLTYSLAALRARVFREFEEACSCLLSPSPAKLAIAIRADPNCCSALIAQSHPVSSATNAPLSAH